MSFLSHLVTTSTTEIEDALIEELKRVLKLDIWPTFNNFEEFVIEHQLLRHKVASLLVTKYKYENRKVVPAWMLFGGALCHPDSPLYSYSFRPFPKRLPLQVCPGDWLEQGDVVQPNKMSDDAKNEKEGQQLEKQWAKFEKPFNSLVKFSESDSKFDVLESCSEPFSIWLSHSNIFDGVLEESIVKNIDPKLGPDLKAWLWIDTKFSVLGSGAGVGTKELLTKLTGLKKKIPERQHILLVVSNRKFSPGLIKELDQSTLLVSRTGDLLHWLLSPACARLYLFDSQSAEDEDESEDRTKKKNSD